METTPPPLTTLETVLLFAGLLALLTVFVGYMKKTGRKMAPPFFSLDDCDWFVLSFYVLEKTVLSDAVSLVVVGKSGVMERLIKFEILISREWEPLTGSVMNEGELNGEEVRIIEETLNLQGGAVVIQSMGRKSDLFIRHLDKKLGTKFNPRGMRSEPIEFGAICLGGDPNGIEHSVVRIKLFADKGEEENYAEVYLNVDLANRRIDFNEKDYYYREPLVRYLAG